MPLGVSGSGRGVNSLLGELTAMDRGRLSNVGRVVSLARGPLTTRDAPIRTILFPLSGFALIGWPMPSGIAPIAGMVASEGLIGWEACLATRQWACQIEVTLPMLALSFERTEFIREIDGSAALRAVCGRYVTRLLAHVARESACAKVHGAQARLATWSIRLSEALGTAVLPLTHETLARIIGVSRQTISMDLALFASAGAVSTFRGRISIRSESLRAFACECLLEI